MESTIVFKTEDQFQAYCVKWFDEKYPAWRKMLFAVPNGGDRPTAAARIMQATGVKRGVADLILVNYGAVHFIELKLPDGTQSGDQILFQGRVEERGHSYYVINRFYLFEELIIKLIGDGK